MSDLRARIGVQLDSLTDAQVKDLIMDSLSAEKLVWALYEPDPCPSCGHKLKPKKVKVDYPDLDKRARFFSTFLDQAKGKPAETKKIEISATRYEDMTREELEAIVDGRALHS